MDHLQAWKKFKDITYDDLPNDVVKVAEQCILDWFGCAIAGTTEPLAKILREEFGSRPGNCSVIGTDLATDPATAALLNGASGHALDFDDTGSTVGCHSTAPVLPAVLAMAEELGSSGKELITAFVVGVEIEGRVGNAIGPEHYAMGWHTTATYGAFGAAAAVAHLLKLDDEHYGIAMGLAASHASGVKANFGTMTKPYHAGHAAESGVNSARLAAKGFTANPDAVAGGQGFIQASSKGADRSEHLMKIADDWLIMGTLFKYHAACHLTHAAIESILKLRTRLDVDDLSSLTITVHPGLLDICGIENPKTGLEGKFSLRGTASLALNGIDTSDPTTFTDEVISSDAVQRFIPKISVETDRSLTHMESRVVWTDKSQRAHNEDWNTGVPASDLNEQGRKLETKFESLCAFGNIDSTPIKEKLSNFTDDGPIGLISAAG